MIEFLKRKWQKEKQYKLKKELWGFRENRMAVRLNMSIKMKLDNGFGLMETKIGSLMKMV